MTIRIILISIMMCIYYNLIIIYIYNYKINSKVLWNFLLSLLSIVLIVLIVLLYLYNCFSTP